MHEALSLTLSGINTLMVQITMMVGVSSVSNFDPSTKQEVVPRLCEYVQHSRRQFYQVLVKFMKPGRCNCVRAKVTKSGANEFYLKNAFLPSGPQFSKIGPAQSRPVTRPIVSPVKFLKSKEPSLVTI